MIRNWLSKAWQNTYVQAVASAALHNQARQLDKLLKMKPGIETLNQMGLPLVFRAIEYGALDAAHVLIERGADVNLRGSTGRTPLMTAAFHGDERLFRALIDNGADVHARDELDGSVLQWAMSAKNGTLANMLMKAGAKMDFNPHERNCFIDKQTAVKAQERYSLDHAKRIKKVRKSRPAA